VTPESAADGGQKWLLGANLCSAGSNYKDFRRGYMGFIFFTEIFSGAQMFPTLYYVVCVGFLMLLKRQIMKRKRKRISMI